MFWVECGLVDFVQVVIYGIDLGPLSFDRAAVSFGVIGIVLIILHVVLGVDETGQVKQIGYHVGFDLLVEWAVAAQTWREIYLEEPRIQLVINHDVKTEKLETVVAVWHIHLEGAVEDGLHRNKCLDDDIFDFGKQLLIVNTIGSEHFSETPDAPLGP